MGFLEKLYNGKYSPTDESAPESEAYHAAKRIVCETADLLLATFSDEQKELWNKHEDAWMVCEEQMVLHTFRQGFLIGCECMKDLSADGLFETE